MKTICFSVSGFLFLVCFFLAGELFVWNANKFDSAYYYATFYAQANDEKEMYKEIENEAKMNSLEVFVVNRETRTTFNEVLTVYTDQETFEKLGQANHFQAGEFDSLFLGKLKIVNKKFESIPENANLSTFQLVGNEKDMIQFKKSLVNKYAGSFPRKSGESNQSALNIALCWGLSLSFILLLSIYKIVLIKKEILLRVIQGESLSSIVYSGIQTDLSVYIPLFALTYLFSHYFTYSTFYLKTASVSFALFLFINTLLYFILFKVDIKKDIHSNYSVGTLLRLSYLYKFGSLCFFLIVIASTAPLINDGLQFYSQKGFYEARRNQMFVRINPSGIMKYIDNTSESASKNLDFNKIQKAQASLDNLFLQEYAKEKMFSLTKLSDYNQSTEILYANNKAFELVKNKFPIVEEEKKSGFYLLVPETLMNEIADIQGSVDYVYRNQTAKITIQYYKGDVSLLNILTTGSIVSEYTRNPVVLVNMDATIPNTLVESSTLLRSSLFRMDEEEWQQFIKRNSQAIDEKNSYAMGVYQWFLQEWTVKKRTLFLGGIILFITAFMEFSMMLFLVVLEQKVRAQEYILKELLGYSFFERYWVSLLLPVITGAVSLVITYYTLPLFHAKVSGISLILVGVFIVVEEGFIIYLCKKYAKRNRVQVLKGGIL
ncbi:hypothetical protein IGI37_001011 [Enterococcus sp. AZ194]|uniref:hypothetical protein n=1 Tax=Enterococcus sp. AZ194 TaxID=2774629 RepID=UPI003F20616E